MKQTLVSVLAILASFASLHHVGAVPRLTMSLLSDGEVLRVSRTDKTGCTYKLMAATTRDKFEDDALLTFARDLQREAMTSKIPLYERPGGEPFIAVFVLREVCGTETAESEPQMVRFPTIDNARNTTLRKYLKTIGDTMVPVTPEIKLTRVLQDISFSRPVALTNAGDERLFLVEQGGLILVFDNSQSKKRTLFLDLTGKTGVTGNERGLFAIAFHPRHSENRRFFVHYTDSSTGESVVEEYKYRATNVNEADPSTAREYLRVSQPTQNHNGGAMVFGPDGYLYISLGDGGPNRDPQGNGQNRTILLGKILRIDVDNPEDGMLYGIPDGNPYAKSPRFRQEIFAYGARNIWKFSFDAVLGTLWAADVGQKSREEVNIVTLGANLGWSIAEGKECFEPPTGCDRNGLTEPVLDYGRDEGASITGGYVYRGSKIPGLNGYYVFADYLGGDFQGGVLWAFPALDSSPRKTVINAEKLFVTGFGEDVENEMYVITFFHENPDIVPAIYRIDPQ